MRISSNAKQAFTLIELLIAASIFAIVIVVAAGIFSSSSKNLVATRSIIRNQQLVNSTTEKMFDDLKSCTSWGQISAKTTTAGTNQVFRIKGIAYLSYQNNQFLFQEQVTEANMIVGFYPQGDKTLLLLYYFNNGQLYRQQDTATDFSSKIFDASYVQDPANDITSSNKQFVMTGSKFDKFSITGNNYISTNNYTSGNAPTSSPTNSPIITLDIKVSDENTIGGFPSNSVEVKLAVASRNYLEEPK